MKSLLVIAMKIANFRKELESKISETKGIDYRKIIAFFNQINIDCGKEVAKIEVEEIEKANTRYNGRSNYKLSETKKEGSFIKIDFFGNIYESHTSDTYQSYHLTCWASSQFANQMEIIKKIKAIA